jgi:fructose-1,6-bisphosphatase/inositol monophosphatase family enzyme
VTNPDDNTVRAVLEIVRDAGAWLAENQSRALGVRKAGGTWLATLEGSQGDRLPIDTSVEQRLESALAGVFPGAAFLGEEQERAPEPGEADKPLLICDPLDGTLPYLNGLGYFAISLLAMHRYPRLAVIYLPVMRRWYAASFEPGPGWRSKAVFYAVREGSDGTLEIRAQGPPERPSAGSPRDSYLWVSSDAHRRLDLGHFEGKIRSLGATATQLALLVDSRNWDPRAVAVTRAKTHDIAAGLVLAAAAGLEIRDMASGRPVEADRCIRECLRSPGGHAPALLIGEPGDDFASGVSLLSHTQR